ncbi:hypothetical protein CCZ01_05875 [Helicobacter monodelphidis]|uniref:DUF2157 domain-containing protein n=1 Tax=Helicobacter sp. 15-1451 TaxID=2004995 RepID=UPI000DCB8752|nr:DUF2157 domain-containing protein [Helicobacter sp. 15-1451]RAX57509.1 hypothetical protein CCZ01_05875 [Helicobacter sp. 15-1451]
MILKQYLQKNLNQWVKEGLIDSESADKIRQKHLQHRWNINSLFAILAFLFFGLALIVFVGANWEEIPRIWRLVLLLAILFINLVYIGVTKNESLRESLGILANFSFSANLFLISQMYHLGDNIVNALLIILIASLSMSWCLRSYVVFLQSYAVSFLWFSSALKYDVLEWGFLLLILLGFFIVYRYHSLAKNTAVLSFVNFVALLYFFICMFIVYDYDEKFIIEFFVLSVILSLIAKTSIFIPNSWKICAFLILLIILFCLQLIIFTPSTFFHICLSILGVLSYFYNRNILFLILAYGICFGTGLIIKYFDILSFSGITFYLKITYSLILVGIGIVFIKRANSAWQYRFGVGLILSVACTRYIEFSDEYLWVALFFSIFAIIFLIFSKLKIRFSE